MIIFSYICYYFSISNCMSESLSNLNQTAPLKKKNTMIRSRKQGWVLDPSYLKLVFLLAIARKSLKSLEKALQDKINEEKESDKTLKKLYLNQISFFDSIKPITKQLEQIQQAKSALQQLKKDILNFLKGLKGQHKRNEINKLSTMLDVNRNPKLYSTVGGDEINFEIGTFRDQKERILQQYSNNITPLCKLKRLVSDQGPYKNEAQLASTRNENKLHLNLKHSNNALSSNFLTQRSGSRAQTPTQAEGREIFLTTSAKSRDQNLLKANEMHGQTKSYRTLKKRLSERRNVEPNTIDRFNKKITHFYDCSTGHSFNGYSELIQLFINNLLEIKGKLSLFLPNILSQNDRIRKRVNSCIELGLSILRSLFQIYIEIACSRRNDAKTKKVNLNQRIRKSTSKWS